MGIIHKLSPQLADMIAAGEVVERPASVIKELVENAIDAGATQIVVEIKNGGITFMRVTDNGCGMSPQDAPTAFLRHATSKISSAEDLTGISTMGFRGEALAAISAVSKIDLLTKTQEADLGISLHLEAGNILESTPAGCPQGTTIIIRELFYNTPARMKFLKRDSVEGSYTAGAVQRQALSHPEISFRFIRDGKLELSTPGDGKLISAIYSAMGRQCAKEMVEVSSTSCGITVSGYVGKPTANRGSRSYQHFFVNGRYVKSKLMSSALEEAYKNQMMVGRFPICVLHLTLNPAAVDVNVHPAKTEVKFLRETDVFDAIRYGVMGTLRKTQDRPEVRLDTKKESFFQTMTAQEYKSSTLSKAEQAETKAFLDTLGQKNLDQQVTLRDSVRMAPAPGGPVRVPVSLIPETPPKPEPKPAPKPESKPEPAPAPEPEQTAMPMPSLPKPEPPKPQKVETPKEQPPYRIIGQTMDTYIIVEQAETLLFIDKHAAHERILFEKLKAQPREIMSQLLLNPIHGELGQEETAVLLEQAKALEGLGFTLEDFGGSLLVRAIPADIDPADTMGCLSQLAQDLISGKRLDPETVHDNLLHTIACKAAIKGGRKTDPMELSALVAELMSREDIQHCPHGRPVCITLSRSSLERQFKRA